MKKLIDVLTGICILMVLLILAACSGGNFPEPSDPLPQPQPATVTWETGQYHTWTIEAMSFSAASDGYETFWTGELQGPGSLTHTFAGSLIQASATRRIRFRYSIGGIFTTGLDHSIVGAGSYNFMLRKYTSL